MDTKEVLEKLRGESNYGVLRGFNSVMALLIACAGGLLIWTGFQSMGQFGAGLPTLTLLVGGALVVCAAIVFYQSASLLVDIADAQLMSIATVLQMEMGRSPTPNSQPGNRSVADLRSFNARNRRDMDHTISASF